jgi:hypothetical protein
MKKTIEIALCVATPVIIARFFRPMTFLHREKYVMGNLAASTHVIGWGQTVPMLCRALSSVQTEFAFLHPH